MGACVDHLQRHPRTGRLSFRHAFPIELRPYIPNQRVELKRSLGASSISEPKALERFQAASAEYDPAATRARKAATRTFDRLDEPTIAYLAKVFERALHQVAEQAVKDGKVEENRHGWDWLTQEFQVGVGSRTLMPLRDSGAGSLWGPGRPRGGSPTLGTTKGGRQALYGL